MAKGEIRLCAVWRKALGDGRECWSSWVQGAARGCGKWLGLLVVESAPSSREFLVFLTSDAGPDNKPTLGDSSFPVGWMRPADYPQGAGYLRGLALGLWVELHRLEGEKVSPRFPDGFLVARPSNGPARLTHRSGPPRRKASPLAA